MRYDRVLLGLVLLGLVVLALILARVVQYLPQGWPF